MRDTRLHFFENKLFADPVLTMIFDLMENKLRYQTVSVSALCHSSGVPMSTAIRRLDDLAAAGYIVRWDDPQDGRRQFVKLTQKATERVIAYLCALDRKLS